MRTSRALTPREEVIIGGAGGLISAVGMWAFSHHLGFTSFPWWVPAVLGLLMGLDSGSAAGNVDDLTLRRHRGVVAFLRSCVSYTGVALTVGLPFLAPLGATMMATSYIQRAGSRAWKLSLGLPVLVSVASAASSELLGRLGLVSSPFGIAQLTLVEVSILVAGAGIVATTARIVAQRESGESALAIERAARHDELLHASTHDSLTGLVNRVGLQSALADALNGASTGHSVAVLYLDLDGFKAVNDTLGHPAGDELLCQVAGRLLGQVREGDVVARLGGYEFGIVLADVVSADDLEALSARAEEALGSPFTLSAGIASIGVSIGTAVTTDASASDEALFAQADASMYATKRRHHQRSPSRRQHAGSSA